MFQMHVLIRKLRSLHTISDEEAAAMAAAIADTKVLKRGDYIAEDGSEPKHSTVMIEGIACRYKTFDDGRRQILSFQYPGDMTDLYSYVMKKLNHAVGALSDCSVAAYSSRKGCCALRAISKPRLHFLARYSDRYLDFAWRVFGNGKFR